MSKTITVARTQSPRTFIQTSETQKIYLPKMIKVVTKFPSPVKCDICCYSFNNSRALDQHIKSDHEEYHNNKSEKSVKEDCVQIIRGTKRHVDESDKVEEKKENYSSEYTKETYPYDEDRKSEEDSDGITFKGKSRKYIVAYNKLKSKMIEGTEFTVNGCKLKIKATPKNKPMKVELTNQMGEKGKAQIQMYNPGKKGATLLVTKSAGEGFETVKLIADDFIEMFLNILLKGLITGEEEFRQYITVKPDIKESEMFRCEKCEKSFTTNHGLKIHSAWHTRNALAQDNHHEAATSFITKNLQNSTCEWCGELFSADLKYQTINALLTHKNTCLNKPKLPLIIQTKRNCDICGYNAKNEKDIKNHRRDQHLNLSITTSPPPKRKRSSEESDTENDMLMDTDEIVLKIEELNLKDKQETEEQRERKRRSDMMDEKVKAIQRRQEEEYRKFFEIQKEAEQIKLKSEEVERAKLKEAMLKKKSEEKKRKIAQNKENNHNNGGITKMPSKYNFLVGEYNNLLKIQGDGSCQPSAKAAILLQDPSMGPQLAMEENSYIVEHWEKMFSSFFTFPHTVTLGGGKNMVFETDMEFLQFLVLNPDSSYMWADHHQLQVTCNLYNTTIQVLTIDSNGEGSILKEAIRPNPAMAPYSLIPPNKPNGEKVDVPEVWLRYTGNNHYDALLKDDHPLMTHGYAEEYNKNSCDDCNFCFTSKDVLKKHQQDTGHTDGFWEILSETEEEDANPTKYSRIEKENLIKEVLEFELIENKKDDNNDANLIKERKDHHATKKTLAALQEEFKKCKGELRIVMEEKERLKIENSDLKTVNKLNETLEKEAIQTKNAAIVLKCDICEYPFQERESLIKHREKHKKKATEVHEGQLCGICVYSFPQIMSLETTSRLNTLHSIIVKCATFKDHQTLS